MPAAPRKITRALHFYLRHRSIQCQRTDAWEAVFWSIARATFGATELGDDPRRRGRLTGEPALRRVTVLMADRAAKFARTMEALARVTVPTAFLRKWLSEQERHAAGWPASDWRSPPSNEHRPAARWSILRRGPTDDGHCPRRNSGRAVSLTAAVRTRTDDAHLKLTWETECAFRQLP